MLNWGYAVTDHVAQGRTVTGGRAVIAGTEDRQHAYVALSCGTDTNMAYVFTVSPKLADPMPGPRPAPELARYDRITAERTVQQAAVATETQHALAVLSGVLDRNCQQLSASQVRQQALADADHLAILHAIWTDQTTRPANSTTAIYSRPTYRPDNGASPATRPDGCGGPFAPPSCAAWRPGRVCPAQPPEAARRAGPRRVRWIGVLSSRAVRLGTR